MLAFQFLDYFSINILELHLTSWVSLVAQAVKNLPAVQDMWVQSLGQEDPLEKEMATHSSVLAWRIPGMLDCRLWGRTESDTTEVT